MSSEQQLADHWLKRNETLNAFILFEGGALSQEMLQIMMEHYKRFLRDAGHSHPCTPLTGYL
ncbi:hypothetical protein CNN69_28970 [Escherichia coli]|nr:hypothetical protein CNN69_28970 [Escherichia coli]